MATDRYSDDHKIVVGNGSGTLTVDSDLVVTGLLSSTNLDLSGGGSMSFSGTADFSGDVSISTPSGVIDFSSSSIIVTRQVPMSLLEWLDSNGYSSAAVSPLFQPVINVADTTSASFTFDTPGLLMQASFDSITIPAHELLNKGSKISVIITCEFENATTFTSYPINLIYTKVSKIGTSTSPSVTGTISTAASTSFVDNTRRKITLSANISFDSKDDLLFVKIQRSASTGGNLVIYAVEVSTESTVYDILGIS